MKKFEFTAELWRWSGTAAWRFVSLPPDVADDILMVSGPPRGFGSVRVEVTVGATTWRTSVFPDSSAGTYLLPMKKAVRDAESLADGDTVTVKLRLVD